MEKLCNLSKVLGRKHGKSNHQNGKYGHRTETVWRVILFMRFNGNISLKIAWGFQGEKIVDQITRNLHINFTIRSP